MRKAFITTNSKETRKLGEALAKELRGGPASTRKASSRAGRGAEIICLTGELGSGKTTFAQGVLRELGAVGPYTSPTFLVMKQYRVTRNLPAGRHGTKHETRKKQRKSLHVTCDALRDVYHIDAYRVGSKDILNLGWEEIISSENNVVIVEWAERIKKIIPKRAVWIGFEHLKDNRRKLSLSSKLKIKSAKLKLKI